MALCNTLLALVLNSCASRCILADAYERREMLHNAYGTPGDAGRVAQASNTHRPDSFGDSTSFWGVCRLTCSQHAELVVLTKSLHSTPVVAADTYERRAALNGRN